MKNVLLLLSFVSCTAMSAQGTFRIYDAQMNDVTGGIMYISDTNATNIAVYLTVENTDTNSHEVTAGRLVLSQPATASNAITWGSIGYTPGADSSLIPEFMSPSGTAPFVGDYYPNNNAGLATINYCVWETGNMSNNSCVTVTFDNVFPAGGSPLAPAEPRITYGPNPATTGIGIGWSHVQIDRVDLYSSDGKLVSTSTLESGLQTEFTLTGMPEGIYYIHCSSSADGFSFSFTFIHTNEE